MPLPVSLYTVTAVIVMDTAGKRILSKYYEHATDFVNSSRKQETFERAVYEKTRKQNNQIALVDNYLVLYKSSQDVIICLIGPTEESNELLLYGAVETIFEALSEIIKPQLDKKNLLDNYDLLALTIDEVIDRGIIIETEGQELAQRMSQAKKLESSASGGIAELKEQTFSSAFNFAKQHLARAILKK